MISALLLLSGCGTIGNVPALSDHDVVFQSPLCLAFCATTLTVADTDSLAGDNSSTSSDTTQTTNQGIGIQ